MTTRPTRVRLLPMLLREVSWPEWRAHAWRHLAACVAVALGVAMGLSVHLVNEAALSEFGAAVRAANGQPDASLRCDPACDDAIYAHLAQLPQVRSAHPMVSVSTYALGTQAERVAVTVLGVDGLSVAAVAPEIWPRAAEGQDRLALLHAGNVFVNSAAQVQTATAVGGVLHVQQGVGTTAWTVAGQVAAGGGPVLVVDIAAAQQRLGLAGQLTRVDVRLLAGWDPLQAQADMQAQLVRNGVWPPQAQWHAPKAQAQGNAALSRAYRVNLTVLALVALFVGAFLVFSVMALSVAQRMPQFALLGVLGLSARERRQWVLAESAATGVVGAALGVVLGVALARVALYWLAGDLGAGFFAGMAPELQVSVPAALGFAALGVLAALAGGWLPARQVQALSPAQALKGMGGTALAPMSGWISPVLLALGGLLALLPPIGGLPVAAYAAVACVLLGGMAGVPWVVAGLLRWAGQPTWAPLLLALARARHERAGATVAVAGVVASLSLAVALTVMVFSFRGGVTQWLDQVLPADLYLRTATRSVASDGAYLPEGLVAQAARVAGVQRVEASRLRNLVLSAGQPPVVLIARPLRSPQQQLPLLGGLPAAPAALPAAQPPLPGVYVSEAVVALYQVQVGSTLALPLGPTGHTTVQVRGVWRDYARQFGAIAMDEADYRALTGDARTNDLALWLSPGAAVADVQAAVQGLVGQSGLMEFAVPGAIRAQSLRIFDRSFAVTYYLQALAMAIGLFGIVASFSAQVLARRREFGLLSHLGFTRRQVLLMVAAEGAVWTAAGTVLGVLLGLAVAAVLVHVVNPQSFHWSMALVVPWQRLAVLCTVVLLATAVAAGLSARSAVSVQAVRAVKEDW